MGHRPKIGGATPRRFWKSILFRWFWPTLILVDHDTGGIGKVISLSLHAYVDYPNQRLDGPVHQFEGKVVLDSELDLKSDSWIPNLLGLPPCCACFLGSPAHSWCPACSPWSTPWFLITIKSLGSNLFSRSLADEHKNEFTWRHSCYAHDLIIGPCNSIERIVVSDVVISSSLGAWHPPWWALSLVIMTHMHDDFGCLSPRDYVDTKSWLAYEQNPYSTHWVRSSSCHREMSLSYDILPVVTRLRANTNISDNWHANPTSSLYDNTAMLWARGLHNFTIASTTLSCFAMWLYLTIPVIHSDSDGTIIQQYHLQAIVQKEKGLLKSAYAKIWSSTSVVHPRLEDSHFEDFKLWAPKLIPYKI
jgi:hypothetical protein